MYPMCACPNLHKQTVESEFAPFCKHKKNTQRANFEFSLDLAPGNRPLAKHRSSLVLPLQSYPPSPLHSLQSFVLIFADIPQLITPDALRASQS
jgi:hypothetical protein